MGRFQKLAAAGVEASGCPPAGPNIENETIFPMERMEDGRVTLTKSIFHASNVRMTNIFILLAFAHFKYDTFNTTNKPSYQCLLHGLMACPGYIFNPVIEKVL